MWGCAIVRPERRACPHRAARAGPPARAPTRAFLRPPRAPRPHTARAPWESARPVSRPHERAPGLARTARVPPGRCPWLAFPSVPPCFKVLWTSPTKRPEPVLACAEPAPWTHRSATVHYGRRRRTPFGVLLQSRPTTPTPPLAPTEARCSPLAAAVAPPRRRQACDAARRLEPLRVITGSTSASTRSPNQA
jgi:hypothetical protein